MRISRKMFIVISVILITYNILSPYKRKKDCLESVMNYDFQQSEAIDIAKSAKNPSRLHIRDGEHVKLNGFHYFAKGMSHHNLFISFHGYYHINIDGNTFSIDEGPCYNYIIVNLNKKKMKDVTKEWLIEQLKKMGFTKKTN